MVSTALDCDDSGHMSEPSPIEAWPPTMPVALVSAAITAVLAPYDVQLLDIGQAVIHDTLSLGLLLLVWVAAAALTADATILPQPWIPARPDARPDPGREDAVTTAHPAPTPPPAPIATLPPPAPGTPAAPAAPPSPEAPAP